MLATEAPPEASLFACCTGSTHRFPTHGKTGDSRQEQGRAIASSHPLDVWSHSPERLQTM